MSILTLPFYNLAEMDFRGGALDGKELGFCDLSVAYQARAGRLGWASGGGQLLGVLEQRLIDL